MKKLKGIHHVTAITSDAQKCVDFYAGRLGMRLVKKTVNFDDPGSYHLYFGDQAGSPGTLLTFFAWPGTPKGRIGGSEPVAVGLTIPKGTLPLWREKLQATEQDGRLSVFDPDGMRLDLLEGENEADSPAIQRIQSITLNLLDLDRSAALFSSGLQFERLSHTLYQVGDGMDKGQINLQSGQNGRGMMGAGTIHHVAFRIDDDESQKEWLAHVSELGLNASPVMDRKYFHSVYFREPSGVLFEIATDPPGMAVDEPAAQLGEKLMLPREYEPSRTRLEAALPPLRTPVTEARV
jgi:glyoxalase family protein